MVIDASTMTEIGRAHVPISIPFGIHNRFYTSGDLGLSDDFLSDRSQVILSTQEAISTLISVIPSKAAARIKHWPESPLVVLAMTLGQMIRR